MCAPPARPLTPPPPRVQQVMSQALSGSDVSAAAVHAAALLLGTAAQAALCVFGTYPRLSGFSAVGCVSTAAVMLLVAILPILDPHKRWLQEAPEHHVISMDIIPATSILAVWPPVASGGSTATASTEL